ncbi:MAG TPA: AI-2E family transporter, partial [Kofleriaceae bacterium]
MRNRRDTWFGDTRGSVLRFLGRWAFVVFIIIVAILGRSVLLPFVFANLIAYILAPIVQRMTVRSNGTRRMPRGLAIIICYIVFVSAVVGFLFLLVPRLSKDVARLGKEAPGLYKRINEEYTPQLARWLEHRFPSLSPQKPIEEAQPIVPEVPIPPGTAFTMTPLPDGRFAIQVTPNGIDVKPDQAGGYHVLAVEAPPEPATLEEKIRAYVRSGLVSLQSKLNDVVRVLQNIITGFIKGI